MQLRRLTPLFYEIFNELNYPEILHKDHRPYYIAIIMAKGLTFGIPFRSELHHSHGYIIDGKSAGLDYTKAVVLENTMGYINPTEVTIRQNEYDFLKQNVTKIEIKLTRRIQANPHIPKPTWYRYSSLQYFHKVLGLMEA